ncbi:bifunctional (p)ppGpp synthetase/guanosine-3',5'-bis(diphosphate) 3'-pyrophosphohydrolase [Comamonas thiooxydans]|uniref:Bifunctional (P)ppGpp synthetase/guanosine-3',5'-bis(Diphosphate) 3'-pyrophosphohydrolase n=1 Tax=Comamonas thiooxydans TaxID=363952 RepID=A0AA42Q438_9BURK|nr:bifunctional (p)ppGpp synthetase/guanosine-3',5'-bis(diphosphate) 3'-pyrophosphohydrolase [Comamonas thiooxydans]MDH1336875.1 bifunctional (p)ppGpp synthetase/guanosine-3',5'-bis(diphosphate) 3'-pyrophosphohydrolase [Comamonas thiooxydans]MDH1743038.1 bifunctional (p)ppGpp synthetase/guanosine-3',5'-bis(diphosphate) 3'-pyrophosphohydrolase [Comamonas thiooxydans]MDH1789346.1 bifunctional (p)ppGpp synthetase/guanosine-3',5'-bis(diphosphate) 3'-pyrophosphohydrolase [Comamonas thiooxydans]
MTAAQNSTIAPSSTAPAKPQRMPADQAARVSAAAFEGLMEHLGYLDADSAERVRQAYIDADQAHTDQWRSSGDPYITHPIAVTGICANWKLDAPALMAALLHDSMEDCGITKLDLKERFGEDVAELVDGLTKLDKLQFNTREENQAESFRKMLLAMARDVRVILIKLADRTHNMRTMSDMPRSKWGRISSETLEIYAPIAHRLGLNQTYRELQDLSFKHLHPWRYATLEKAIGRSRTRRRDLVHRVQDEVSTAFATHSLSVRLLGRESTLYSLYQRMQKNQLSFAKVTDIYGFRIIVPKTLDCYTALGVLHQKYKPMPGRFKDYIAIAKSNGYQSLHTTLVGPSSVSIEFQIRTEEMNIVAEAGVAAHWLYKAQQGHDSEHLSTQWLQSLLDIQNETRDAAEFWDHVKVDLFPDAVYVFTPKSEIMAMPRGATVVDFAYAIHSKIGHRTTAAKINDEEVPLRTELKSGDVVQIITSETSTPNPAWLSFVKTGRARSKIRSYLKNAAQTEAGQLGETLLAQALRAEGIDSVPAQDDANKNVWDEILRITGNRTPADLMVDIGMGRRIASLVAARMTAFMTKQGVRPDALLITQERFNTHNRPFQGAVTLNGDESSSVYYSHCCRPVPGDPILGYLGGQGLVVHHAHCNNAIKLREKDADRFITVDWSDDITRLFEAGIVVTVQNNKGVLARVAAELSNAEADIVRVEMTDEAAIGTTDLRFVISVQNSVQLENALRNLRRLHSVIRASRVMA